MGLFWGLNEIKEGKWSDLSPAPSDERSDSSCQGLSLVTQDASSPSQLPASHHLPSLPLCERAHTPCPCYCCSYSFLLFILSLRWMHSTKNFHLPHSKLPYCQLFTTFALNSLLSFFLPLSKDGQIGADTFFFFFPEPFESKLQIRCLITPLVLQDGFI